MIFKNDNDKIKKQNLFGKISKISKINSPVKNIFSKKVKSQKILKSNKKQISSFLLIKTNLLNHNITKVKYDIIMINNLIDSNSSHFLVCYKENNLNSLVDEFFRRFYNIFESKDRLPKIANYYYNYSLFFVKPTFRISYANKIIKDYSERQAKYFYILHYERFEENNNNNDKSQNLKLKYEKIFNDDVIKKIDSSLNKNNESDSISIPDLTSNSYKFSNESSVKSILNCFNNFNENNHKNNNNNKINKNIKKIVPAIKNFNKVIKVEKREKNEINSQNRKRKQIPQLQLKKIESILNKNESQTYRIIPIDKKISSKIFSDLSTSNSLKKNISVNNKLSHRHISNTNKENNNKDILKKKTIKHFSSNKSRNVNRKQLSLNWNFNTITQNDNLYSTIINNKGIKSNFNLNELIDIFHTNTERNENKNENILTFHSPTINNINININNNICINTNNNRINTRIQKSRNITSKNTKSNIIKTTSNNYKIKNLKKDSNIYKTNCIPYSERRHKNYISPISTLSNISPRRVKKISKEKTKKFFSSEQTNKKTHIIKVQKTMFTKPKKI